MLQLLEYSCVNLDLMETEMDAAWSRVKINSKELIPGRKVSQTLCSGRRCGTVRTKSFTDLKVG